MKEKASNGEKNQDQGNSMTPLVCPYNPAWPQSFSDLKTFLEEGMPVTNYSIEHVGSTSIPGMVAKPIIDVDIIVNPGAFEQVKMYLEGKGYNHLGDLGLGKREAFELEKPALIRQLPVHHLYVCDRESDELIKHLAFRDFMRKYPDWVLKLSRLKVSLCERFNHDKQAYIEGKDRMVRDITRLALAEWHSERSAAIDPADQDPEQAQRRSVE